MRYTTYYLLVLVPFLLTIPLLTIAQNFHWAISAGSSPANDVVNAMTVDDSNNVYVVGDFGGTVDFDPGPAVFNLKSKGAEDIFVAKFSDKGEFKWARSFGGPVTDRGFDIAVDKDGNVYSTGIIVGDVDFDPGPDTFLLPAKGVTDIFISKLDRDGNFVWAKGIGGAQLDYANTIALDETGNVYVGGFYRVNVDFDPGDAIFEHRADGEQEIFILKLDPEGNFVWVKPLRGTRSAICSSLIFDNEGNILFTGSLIGSVDFDPGPENHVVGGSLYFSNAFIAKWDAQGNYKWSGGFTSENGGNSVSIASDAKGNVYTTGLFSSEQDFDPGPDQYILSSTGIYSSYISKLDSSGNFLWAKNFSSDIEVTAKCIAVDAQDYVHMSGEFRGIVDFDPGAGYQIKRHDDFSDGFLIKVDPYGEFISYMGLTKGRVASANAISFDNSNRLFLGGSFKDPTDFDPGPEEAILSGNADIFLARYNQKGVTGDIYQDLDANCERYSLENGLAGRRAIIKPGNIVVETNRYGLWHTDYLSPGDYSITFDTSGKWFSSCPNPENFTLEDTMNITYSPNYGLRNSEQCTEPEISVSSRGFFRRCVVNRLDIVACNLPSATDLLDDAYVILTLDPLMTPVESSLPFIDLGNNKYRFDIGNLYPDQCISFWINALLDCKAIGGQTFCIEANLFPADSCAIVSGETFTSPDDPPCALNWDQSNISLISWCENDSLHFVITNSGQAGEGDMQCYSPVRLFIDGKLAYVDSIKLQGNTSDTRVFSGDGRTWRMEVDQHPRYPFISRPSTTTELCGPSGNWTPDLVNILSHDDQSSIVDIQCNIVRASFDPNDKTGFPLGIESEHKILPNQKMEYVIRFQNTGNDTAFLVIIRDTLEENLDIFSVRSGASSHEYGFRMYGPRVLEWTFPNIMLPDSNVNLEGSNGFISFSVDQEKDLVDGTLIQNKAAIYFDFNEPVITNLTSHKIDRNIQTPGWSVTKEFSFESCDPVQFQYLTYTKSGTYWQINEGGADPDTLITLNMIIHEPDIEISQMGDSLVSSQITGATYQWMNCTEGTVIHEETTPTYTPTFNGNYAVIVSQNNCVDTSACFEFLSVGAGPVLPDGLKVFPNPTTGNITVEFGEKQGSVEIKITNLYGQVVMDRNVLDATDYGFELEGEPGIYFMYIKSGRNVWGVRVLKL